MRKPAWDQRSDPPVAFIICAPHGERPPAGAEWLHEVKHDGYRMVARKDGSGVRLWTRALPECTEYYGLIATAIAQLPVDQCVIDGEAVRIGAGGRSNLKELSTPGGTDLASLVCFDLLELSGEDIRYYPIEERRALLFSILEEDKEAPLIFNHGFNQEGVDVFAHVCSLHLEGIVSKRRNSVYPSGESPDWVVTLNPGYVRPARAWSEYNNGNSGPDL